MKDVRKPRIRRELWRSFLLFSAVTYVIPDVYSTVVESRCQEWLERKVDPLYLNREQLEAIGSEVATMDVPVLPGGYSGLALPGLVAVTDEATESTLLHEMVHQEQMRRDGEIKYAFKYVTDWYKGRYAGCSTSDSYQAISYEKQARATARNASREDGAYEDLNANTTIEWVKGEIIAILTSDLVVERQTPDCVQTKYGLCLKRESE